MIRRPHDTDRRSFLIELTSEGTACFKEHHQFHLTITQKIIAGLTPDEEAVFAGVLEKILKKL